MRLVRTKAELRELLAAERGAGRIDRTRADDGLPARRPPIAARRRARALRRRRDEPVRQPDPVPARRGSRRLPARRAARRRSRRGGRRRLRVRAVGRGDLPRRLRDLGHRRGPERGALRRSRPARAGALPRGHDGRHEAAQHRRARRRLLRPKGRSAGDRDPAAHGPRPRLPGRDRGTADDPRERRPRALLAQRLPRPRRNVDGPPPCIARSSTFASGRRPAAEVEPILAEARTILAEARIEPEYLEARDAETLEPARELQRAADPGRPRRAPSAGRG